MPLFVYNRNIPDGPNNPSVDQPDMQTNTNSIDDLIDVDHYSFNDSNGGLHRQLSMPNQASPTLQGDTVIYSRNSNGVSVPWIKNASYDLPLITGPSAALNLNGYSSIFAGVIIQWGVVNASGTFFQNADSGTVTFSTPFPLTAVGVFTQPCWTVPIPPTSNATIAIDSSTLTNTSFSWNFVTGSGSTYNKFFWWAIGF